MNIRASQVAAIRSDCQPPKFTDSTCRFLSSTVPLIAGFLSLLFINHTAKYIWRWPALMARGSANFSRVALASLSRASVYLL